MNPVLGTWLLVLLAVALIGLTPMAVALVWPAVLLIVALWAVVVAMVLRK